MFHHNHKRLWTPLERRNIYEYGSIYCARFGFERFKKMGENHLFFIFDLTNYFNLTIFIFFIFFQNPFSYILFFFLELKCWEVCSMQFDDEDLWLSRPGNPKPLSRKDQDRRRVLLHSLGNQLARYLAVIQANDRKIKNMVAKENPITLN